jgi:predicted Zn-dependent protease
MAKEKTDHRLGWRAAAVSVLSLLLSGCVLAGPSVRKVSLPHPPKQVQAPRDHQRILASYGGAYHDPRLEAFVARIVTRLTAASEKPELRYKVTILNSPAVNACALPNGQLYITRGLIALANDSSELASVLAHEMVHVLARHGVMRDGQTHQATVSRGTGDAMADPYLGALALAKSKIALATFARAQEFEADSTGIGIVARAGFDPDGAVRFLTALDRIAHLKPTDGRNDPHFLDFVSHPATPERVDNARASARQQRAANGGGERGREAYLAAIEGLIFGDDTNQGYVRGRRFLHPKFGFTFTAPEGFVLENTAQAVLGLKDGGRQTLKFDVVRVPTDQPLANYISAGWIEGVDPLSIEELVVNSFPAVTATAHSNHWAYRLYAVRFGSEVYRIVFAAREKTPETDRRFRDSFNTFRHLLLAEIETAKPQRLAVIEVGVVDTVERLANRMSIAERPLEHFRVLNGLAPDQIVEPGDRVKIVVE